MDQTPLVEEQIAEGKRLLEWLAEAGFPVTVAGWVRETQRWDWHLYLVSPVVEDQGIRIALRRIRTLIQQMPQPLRLGRFDLMVVGSHKPLGEALVDLQRHHPGKSYFHFGGSQLNCVEVEAVYIYPPVALAEQPHRQAVGK
jgi:hypothetical protein